MLPKSQRLNLRKDFKSIRSGKRAETSNLILFYKFGENQAALVGISMSSKVFKKAHDRNRARRLAATAVQATYPNLINSLNLVIMPKESILQAKIEDLEKELSEAIKGIR